jgi:AraC-like DNA-binding protein
MLLKEWQRQAGQDLPAPPLRLPRRSEGSYTVRIRQQAMFGFFVEDQYSDAVAGRTGGQVGHMADRIAAHLTIRGEWRFASARDRFTVGAGLLLVRNNEKPWDFEVANGTKSLLLMLPAEDIRRSLPNEQALMVEQDRPAARLLLGHLHTWAGLAHTLSPAAARSARAAGLELFRGLLNDQVIDDEEFSAALARAAMERVEDRLLTDPDLGPGEIAASLHVSVRTLHRAFANERATVMGYVQERRLERARAELLSSSSTVSEIAARWHFSDSSHFIKSYKKRFGDSPTADRRQNSGFGTARAKLVPAPTSTAPGSPVPGRRPCRGSRTRDPGGNGGRLCGCRARPPQGTGNGFGVSGVVRVSHCPCRLGVSLAIPELLLAPNGARGCSRP